jgi:virginiamycin A acetyltransferase
MGIHWKIRKIIKFFKTNVLKDNAPPYLITNSINIIAGKESYHNGNFIVKGNGLLKIGNYCAIGQDVKIILSNHNFNYISMQYTFYRKNFGELPYKIEKGNTIIGNDVWIGDNVIVLPNVTIGTGAVLGGGSVVTKDVEPYTIVAGNPARVIKKRFSPETLNELLMSQWWDWDQEKILAEKDFFFKNYNHG